MPPETRRSACPGFYNRPKAADGRLCRLKLGTRFISLAQLGALAACAEDYGSGALELTNRGSIQLRGIKDGAQAALTAALTAAGLAPRSETADNISNIMLNPTAGIAKSFWGQSAADAARACAAALEEFCRTEQRLQTLSPKFSFYADGGELCAVPDHKNDIWLSFLPADDASGALWCLIGLASSLPQTPAEMAAHCLGLVRADAALAAVKAALEGFLAAATQDSGLSRMKHWRARQPMVAIRAAVNARLPAALRPAEPSALYICAALRARANAARQQAGGDKSLDFAMRALALGAHETGLAPGSAYLGLAPPLGRFTARSLRRLIKLAAQSLAENTMLRISARQSLIFAPCATEAARRGARLLAQAGFISSAQAPFAPLLCCAGAPFCSKAKANVQEDAAALAQAFSAGQNPRGMVHLTGCAKSCAATNAQFFTLRALAPGHYAVYQNKKEAAESQFGELLAADLPLSRIADFLQKQDR